MRNPELALTTAYMACLEDKISANGRIVPVFTKSVPSGVEAPFIVIGEINVLPDTQFASGGGLACSVLIDVVNFFDNAIHEYSLAARIADFVMELTDRDELLKEINSATLSGTVILPDVGLVTPSGEADNSTVLWDVNKHLLEAYNTVTEPTETKTADRRLIRFRDILYQTTLII